MEKQSKRGEEEEEDSDEKVKKGPNPNRTPPQKRKRTLESEDADAEDASDSGDNTDSTEDAPSPDNSPPGKGIRPSTFPNDSSKENHKKAETPTSSNHTSAEISTKNGDKRKRKPVVLDAANSASTNATLLQNIVDLT